MKTKKHFKEHKYLYHTISLSIALLAIVGFRSDTLSDYFKNLQGVLIDALIIGFGIFLFQMFAGWFLWFFIPKSEDFQDDNERDQYFSFDRELKDYFFPLIYIIIAVVLALQIEP